MKKISEKEIAIARQKFMNKKISFKTTTNNDIQIGKCEFIGYNEKFPSWNFQVTINRTPFKNVDLNKIK